MVLPSALASLAEGQDQLFTRSQAIEKGLSASALDRRIRAGVLVTVHPGVYRVHPADDTFERQCRAAVLAVGAPVALARRAAAARFGAPGIEAVVELSVPIGCRRSLTGVTLLRNEAPLDYSFRSRGIYVHDHARVVIDLAGVLDRDALELVVDHALRERWFRISELDHLLGARVRRGRRGVRVLEALIQQRRDGRPLVISRFEQRLFRLFESHGLALPDRQHRVRLPSGGFRVLDFAYPQARVAIEAESYEFHSGRQAWSNDRVRQNVLATLGWRRVNVTWDDIETRPTEVIAWVRAALQATNS